MHALHLNRSCAAPAEESAVSAEANEAADSRLCRVFVHTCGSGCVHINYVSLCSDLFLSPVDNPSDNVTDASPLYPPSMPFFSFSLSF